MSFGTIQVVADSDGKDVVNISGDMSGEEFNQPFAVLRAAMSPMRANWVFVEFDTTAVFWVVFYDQNGAPVTGPMLMGAGHALQGLDVYSFQIVAVKRSGMVRFTFGMGEPGRLNVSSPVYPQALQVVLINSAATPTDTNSFITPVTGQPCGFSMDYASAAPIYFEGVSTAHWQYLRLSLANYRSDGTLRRVQPWLNMRTALTAGFSGQTPSNTVGALQINAHDVIVWDGQLTAAGVAAAAALPNVMFWAHGYRIFSRGTLYGGS